MDVVSALRDEIAERKYKTVNVPLGKPQKMNPVLRQKKFGIATKSSESIKSVMDLTDVHKNSDAFHHLYLKSHNHFGVSEKVSF